MKLELFRWLSDLVFGWATIKIEAWWAGRKMRLKAIHQGVKEALRLLARELSRLVFLISVISFWTWLFSLIPGMQPGWRIFWPSLGATAVIFAAYLIARGIDNEKWEKHNRPLDGPCRADSDPYIAPLEIRGSSSHDRTNFLNACKRTPKEAKNILLILRQTGKRYRDLIYPYTIESLAKQINAIRMEESERYQKIEWVSFVSFAGTFVAYQSMKKFVAELRKGNTNYAEILNTTDPKHFREAIKKQIDDEKDQKSGKPAPANIVPGLERGFLYNFPLKVREAIFLLQRNGWNEAMLVSATERRPIGIVTLNALLNVSATLNLLSVDQQKTLTEKNKAQDELSEDEIEVCEGNNQPKPCPDFGDDSPERDAMVPAAPTRPGVDLRFRLPSAWRRCLRCV